MRKALTRLLRSEGFDVRAFASAAEFLAGYRAEETACLVLDVGMPELDGMDLQRRLTDADVSCADCLSHRQRSLLVSRGTSVPS
jgi:FixJ family two-component response regulator